MLGVALAKISIVNVVATASLGQELDFSELREFKEIFHDSDVYGGRVAYFKTCEMEGRVSLFSSGKMISVGTKSEQRAFHELKHAMSFLVENGFARALRLCPKTQNIVVRVDFEREIDLEELPEYLGAIYEPEQFPGVILRIDMPYKATILVFASGKAVVVGLTSSKQVNAVVRRLEHILRIKV